MNFLKKIFSNFRGKKKYNGSKNVNKNLKYCSPQIPQEISIDTITQRELISAKMSDNLKPMCSDCRETEKLNNHCLNESDDSKLTPIIKSKDDIKVIGQNKCVINSNNPNIDNESNLKLDKLSDNKSNLLIRNNASGEYSDLMSNEDNSSIDLDEFNKLINNGNLAYDGANTLLGEIVDFLGIRDDNELTYNSTVKSTNLLNQNNFEAEGYLTDVGNKVFVKTDITVGNSYNRITKPSEVFNNRKDTNKVDFNGKTANTLTHEIGNNEANIEFIDINKISEPQNQNISEEDLFQYIDLDTSEFSCKDTIVPAKAPNMFEVNKEKQNIQDLNTLYSSKDLEECMHCDMICNADCNHNMTKDKLIEETLNKNSINEFLTTPIEDNSHIFNITLSSDDENENKISQKSRKEAEEFDIISISSTEDEPIPNVITNDSNMSPKTIICRFKPNTKLGLINKKDIPNTYNKLMKFKHITEDTSKQSLPPSTSASATKNSLKIAKSTDNKAFNRLSIISENIIKIIHNKNKPFAESRFNNSMQNINNVILKNTIIIKPPSKTTTYNYNTNASISQYLKRKIITTPNNNANLTNKIQDKEINKSLSTKANSVNNSEPETKKVKDFFLCPINKNIINDDKYENANNIPSIDQSTLNVDSETQLATKRISHEIVVKEPTITADIEVNKAFKEICNKQQSKKNEHKNQPSENVLADTLNKFITTIATDSGKETNSINNAENIEDNFLDSDSSYNSTDFEFITEKVSKRDLLFDKTIKTNQYYVDISNTWDIKSDLNSFNAASTSKTVNIVNNVIESISNNPNSTGVILDNEQTDSDYNSSDFEFITEKEAKTDLLLNKTIGNNEYGIDMNWWNRIYTPNSSLKDLKRQSLNYQKRHVIPQGDDYLRLFRDNVYNPVVSNMHLVDNKSIRPLQSDMFQGIGFQVRMVRRNSSSEEDGKLSEETRNRILRAYPQKNTRRRNSYLGRRMRR